MRMKWIAAVGVAAVVCALAPPAAVGAPAQAAAGSLYFGWQTDQQDAIALWWPDVPAVTRVTLQDSDGVLVREYDVGADQSLTVHPAELQVGGLWRFASYGEHGLIARTALFDSAEAVPATVTRIGSAPGALGISFRLGRVADSTPGDPLDTVSATVGQDYCGETQPEYFRYRLPSGDPDKDYSIGFSRDLEPARFQLATNSGFGAPVYTDAWVHSTYITAVTMPRTGTWSLPLTFTATVYDWVHGGCESYETPSAPQRVWLQGRKGPGDAWQTITAGLITGSKFVARTPATGNREYRLSAPEVNPVPAVLKLSSATAAAPVTVATRLLSAKFSDATVTTTQRTTASIWVGPYGSQLATLQYRRSSTAPWAAVVNRKLVSGRVSYTFAWNRKGVTSFRWVVAPTTYAGLRVEGKTTGNMVLTVR